MTDGERPWGWQKRGESRALWGLGGGPVRPKRVGHYTGSGGSGSRGVRLTGIVQEKHQRDPPGQHGVAGSHQDTRAEERPGRHRLGPGPTRKTRGEEPALGEGPRSPWDWRIRAVGGAELAEGGCLLDDSRGRVGPQANRCLRRLRAGPARAQPVTPPTPAPTSQVTFRSP